jgi:4-amino-4-deoxy-L-arabinose transferase-like glycosyltransferase
VVRRFPHARVAAAWAATLCVVALALAARGYHTRDPDSVLYARISAALSRQPVETWIAPDWPPDAYARGRFREHPVGLFVPAALVGRLGYPAEQAAYLVNAGYQVLALLLVPILAAAFAGERQTWRLASLLQLLPIAFTYRVRANHEGALLLFFLLALLATERAREKPAYVVLTVVALDGLMLVKGLVVLPALLACAAWLLASAWAGRRTAFGWAGLALGVAVLLATALAYEAAYVRATGESFLGYYLGRAVRGDPNPASALSDTLYNLVWYCGRLLWFAAPWSVLPLIGLWRRAGAGTSGPDRSARAGLIFTLAVVAVFLGLFSFGERRAERYIFPAYFVVGAAGALASQRRWPRLERALAPLDSPYAPVAIFLATLALHLLGGVLQLPRIKLWKADV